MKHISSQEKLKDTINETVHIYEEQEKFYTGQKPQILAQ